MMILCLVGDSIELEARRRISKQILPYVFPGELCELQVDVLAAGDRTLYVLHVDWMRKIADLTCQALYLDCQELGFWFGPLIQILPEKIFSKALKKIPRKKRLNRGSLGVSAYYAHKILLDPRTFLRNSSRADLLIYNAAMQSNFYM